MGENARLRHLENVENLEGMDEQIGGIKKVGAETEQVAKDILVDMYDQRGGIVKATEDTHQTRQNVLAAKKVVIRMTRKEFCYKILLYILVIALFAAFLVVLVAKIANA